MSVLAYQQLRYLYPTARRVGPASIDLTLGDTLLALAPGTVLDPERDQADAWTPKSLGADGRWHLDRQRPYLGITAEKIDVPPHLLGLLHGVSSIGRLFLLIHVTAGVVDPGWSQGRLTLELFPLAAPVLLRPGQRIGQITLHELTSSTVRTYSGRYAGDQTATPSRAHLDGGGS